MKVYKAANRKTKVSAIAVCLLLTAMLAIGGTLAYLFTQTTPVVNTFNPVDVDIEIVEKLEGNIKSDVQIVNTGKTDAFIRAKVVITWQNADGDVYSSAPVAGEGKDYSIVYNETDWVLGSDGFWYCKNDVAPNALSAILINEAKPLKLCEDTAYTLHIEILSQAIQSTPENAVVDTWVPVTAATDGVLTVTPKA